MKCPKCNGRAIVKKTIDKKHFSIRYRTCKRCGYRFKTKEMATDDWDYKVIVEKIIKVLEGIR